MGQAWVLVWQGFKHYTNVMVAINPASSHLLADFPRPGHKWFVTP